MNERCYYHDSLVCSPEDYDTRLGHARTATARGEGIALEIPVRKSATFSQYRTRKHVLSIIYVLVVIMCSTLPTE